uniref:PPC89 centrosome localisation domain-containing protein n=3 Tax=Timema TaxID=61471 RepID=A0A7R9B510_TIMSH|nr:unnamed protein product [Timema shepardi]CAD7572552.1 unnamed protein product [Timema californicum]
MSFDSMRGNHGRCPPFIVGGLLVLCFILTFNWWSLSSQNYDLIKQIEELGEQLKISSEEQDLCVHQRLSIEGRIKNMDEEMTQLRVRLEQQRTDNDETKRQLTDKESEIKNTNKERDGIQESLVACNTELESLKKLDISKDGTIASLRLEKDRFVSQLEERRQESLKLRAELETVQEDLTHMKSGVSPNIIVVPKSSTVPPLHPWDLKMVDIAAVKVNPEAVRGMLYHNMPILPRDPPDAFRPKPRFSVTYLTPAPEILAKPEIGLSVGGDHEKAIAQDLNKAENEENNAAEKVDDEFGLDDPAQQDPRMEVPNEQLNNDEAARKDDAKEVNSV